MYCCIVNIMFDGGTVTTTRRFNFIESSHKVKKIVPSPNTRQVKAHGFDACGCCLVVDEIPGNMLHNLSTTLIQFSSSPSSIRSMSEESWSSNVSLRRAVWLPEFMRIASVSAKV